MPAVAAKRMQRPALLILDMINTFDYEGGQSLRRHAEDAAPRIAALRRRFRKHGAPVIFVNDNFLQWRVDFRQLVEACSRASASGARIARLLEPASDDYSILKPKHSGFVDTPLALLLSRLEVDGLVLTGIAADSCVVATALHAHMLEYRVHVPADCVAAITAERRERALALLRDSMRMRTAAARTVRP